MKGVGADLQDHYQARVNYRSKTRNTINDMMGSLTGRVAAGLRYALLRKGFLTIGAGYAGAFAKTDPMMATPDVQFHFITVLGRLGGAEAAFVAGLPDLNLPASPREPRLRAHQVSRSAQAPAIQPRYLTAQADRDCMVAGMKLLRRVMSQPAIMRYIDEELAFGQKIHSDDDYA